MTKSTNILYGIKGGRQTAVSHQDRWIVWWIRNINLGSDSSKLTHKPKEQDLSHHQDTDRGTTHSQSQGLLEGDASNWNGLSSLVSQRERTTRWSWETSCPESPNREAMKFPSRLGKCFQSRDKGAEGLPYKLVITAWLNGAKGLFGWHQWLSKGTLPFSPLALPVS